MTSHCHNSSFRTASINHLGIDHSKDVPEQVEIVADAIVGLDIDINTGIR